MNVAPLHTDHITEIEVTTDSLAYLSEHGYKWDVCDRWCVTSESGNGYVVQAVETTAVPFEHADVVDDSVRMYVCTCDAYRYHDGVADLSDRDTLEWHACKHVEAVDKSIKAANDDKQATL